MSSTLTSANSFNLNDTPYAGTAYNATLTGVSKTAQAQSSGTLSGGAGDTLVASAAAKGSTLFGGSHNDSLLALGANNVLVQNSTGTDTLVGNATTTFQLGEASLLGHNSLKGTGLNGLLISSTLTDIPDSLLSSLSGIGAISLTGTSAIRLGAVAAGEKLNKVFLGNGGGIIERTAGYVTSTPATLVGGSGNDLFIQDAAAPNQSIAGGTGIDTLQQKFVTTLTDAPFTNMTNLEVLSLDGGSAVTLGANASKVGFMTITGGGEGAFTINGASDTNTLTINTSSNASGHDLITATNKNDLVIVNGNNFTTETVNGGTGIDTLLLTNPATINDGFANIKSIEVLDVTSPSSVTLNGNAKVTGITTVIGGAGSDSFTQLAGDTLAITFVGGSGNDTFAFANQSLFAPDSVAGGPDTLDTIQFLAPVTLADSAFARVTGVEVLSLNGSSQVTLGAVASGAGFNSIVGGTGPSTITAALDTPPAGTLTFDMSASNFVTAPGDSLIGSFTSPNDFIVNGTQFELDTIRGGVRSDTIQVNGTLSTEDGFQNIHGVEVLSLGGTSQVTLGAVAAVAGIKEVLGTVGDDTLVQTSANTSRLTLLGGSGNDSISVFSQSELAGDSIGGGTGNNTLQIGSSAYLNDAFANVTGIQNLNLSSQSSVTLGANAQNTGITLVTGGQGSDTFTQTAADTLHTALFAGGDSALFKIANSTLLGNDTIVGGVGSDTLALTTASQTLSSFTNVFGIDVLSLAGGSNAATLTGSSFSTVIGGSGNDSFTEASLGQFAINGAGGINTIALTSHGYTYDSQFGGTSSVQVLKTASGSYNIVSLGSQAHQSGLSTIVSGAGSANIILDTSAFGNRLAVDGSAAAANLIFFDNVDQFGGSTLIGNTLTSSSYSNFADIAGGGNVGDGAFQNKTHLSELYIGGTASYKYGTGSSAPTGITLGSHAQDAGTTFVGTGSGKYGGPISINQLASDTLHLSLTGGDGNDSFTVANSSLLANDTINGGNGTDTLAISSTLGQTISAFSNVSNVDILSLTSGSDAVTLTGSTFSTVIGGGGNDSFTEASLGSFFINGGTGTNTVTVTNSGSYITDKQFGSLANVQVLQTGSDSPAITLGSQAQAAGIQSIIGGTGSAYVTENSGFNNAIYDNQTASSRYTGIQFSNLHQFVDATLLGGSGGFGVNIDANVAIADNYFSNDRGVTKLFLNYPLASESTVTLGAHAQTAGITLVANNGNADSSIEATQLATDTLHIEYQLAESSYAHNSRVVLANSTLLANDTIVGSGNGDTLALATGSSLNSTSFAHVSNVSVLALTGSNNVTLNGTSFSTVVGGGGNDSFTEASLGSFFINGGNGIDTVALTQSQSIMGNDFRGLSSVEVLKTADAGFSTVVLGVQANNSGITSVIGGAGSTLNVYDTPAYNLPIYIDGSTSANVGVLFNNSELAFTPTIYGGTGNNNTVYTNWGSTLQGQDFVNLHNIQNIVVNMQGAGSSSVTLDGAAQTTGVTLVSGGLGSLDFTQEADNTKSLSIVGGIQGDNEFEIANTALLANDTIVGTGEDTLELGTDSQTLTSFAHISGIEVLETENGNNVIDLTNAPVGLQSVLGGSGNDSFAVASTNSGSYANFGHATIVGNGGTDTVSLSVTNNFSETYSSAFVEDTTFGALKQIEVVNVSVSATGAEGAYATSFVTLGAQALAAGVQSLSASASASSDGYAVITETAEFNRAVALTLGGANSNYLNLDNGVQFVGDTITAVANADVSIAQSTTLSDSAFLNKSGILFLDLNDHSAGSSSVELGTYASLAGVNVVYANGGELRATIDGSYGHASGNGAIVYGGNGNDFVQASSIDQINFYSGSNGTDTLAISSGSQTLSGFNNISSVEVLSLSGGDNVVDLTGVGSQFTTVIGGSGNDSFTVANLGAEIVGNGGNDTVALTNGGTIADTQFGRLSNIEVLQVGSGFSEVELGVQAQIAGISTVVAGSNSSIYLSVDANYNRGLNFQGSASSNYEGVLFNSANLDFAPTLAGGSNPFNTINLEYGSTISDNLFSNVSGFPVVDLNSQTGASAITLAGAAQSAGILTVDGGQGSVNITQTADDTLATVLNGGNAGNNSFTVAPSGTIETLTGSALYNSIGINTSFSNYAGLSWSNARMQGGPAKFANWTGDNLTISGANGLPIEVLGENVLSDVDAVDTLSMSGYDSLGGLVWTSSIEVNQGSSVSLAGSNQAVSYVVEKSQLGNLTFNNLDVVLPNTNINSVIIGNGSHNSLNISSSAYLNDAAFTNVHNMTVLSLTGASDVTLGGIALGNNNLQSVFGGNGGDSFAIGNLGTIDIVGGTGTDTIGLTNSAYAFISDSLFSKVASVEVLKTSASGSYTSISLGSAAQESGVSTIVATPSNDTVGTNHIGDVYVDVQRGFNRPLYFDALNTAAPIGLRFATATQVDHATIYGGTSTLNELAVQSTATLNDSQFQNIHNIQELNLNEANVSGLSDVTLGANAFATGIASIYGGNGTIDVTQTTEDSSALYIVGGELGGNVYNIGDFSLLGGQSLPPPNNAIVPAIPNPFIAGDTIFGSGNDTLIVGGTSTIANQFVNIHGVEALSLTGSNSSVLIDDSAYATGIETVYGAVNGSTIGQQATGTVDAGVNIYGNDGNDLIALVGTDSLNHSAIALLNNDVIDGGRGVNTIALTSSSKYNEIGDQSFVNVENVQNLVLGYNGINPGPTAVINPAINVIGAYSVTLGSSAFHAGLQTVTAGQGDTVYAAWNETGRDLTLDASNNFINGQNTSGFNLLIGQQERGAVGLNDVLTNSLLGNESFFYDTLSAITQPYPYTNEFIVNNGAALSTSTVVGGLGFNDSLYINSPYSVGGSVQDSDFQNTNFINNLVLNGNSGATLGAEASAAFNTFGTGSSKYGPLSGVHTVWGGHDYDTATGNTLGDTIVQQTSWSSYHGLTVVGGHGNDSIVVDSYALLQNDSIYGGFSLQSGGVVTNHGMDTLAIEGGVTLNDSFGTGQVNEIEALQLSCNTGAEGDVGSAITLGANFASLGLGSIYGSDCNDTITILSTDTLASYVNGLDGNDSVTVNFGGTTSAKYNTTWTATAGGTTETLTPTGYGSPVTTNLNFYGVNSVSLNNLTTQSGYSWIDFNQMIVDVQGIGLETITPADFQTGIIDNSPTIGGLVFENFYNATNIYFDAPAGGGGGTVPWNGNHATIVSADGSPFSLISATHWSSVYPVSLPAFNGSTLDGGVGTDTLHVGVTATLHDSDFVNVSRFEALQLTSTGSGSYSSAVTLGATAQSAGFVSVYGGAGVDTIVQLGSDTLVNYIQGNGGNDTISVANDTLMANDTIDGGSGSNTLNAASSASSYRSYSDLVFANKSNLDVLTTNLVGSGTGFYTSVSLGGNASLAGFSSVISGSASGNYITQESSNNKALYIDNSASTTYSGMYFHSDTLFASDTVVGASRNIANPYNNWTDVYNGPTLSDSAFQHKTSLSGLYVYGNSAVTLEGNAQTAGISGLYAAAGNDTLTVTTGDTLVSTIRGGAGNDLVTVPSLSQFGGLYGGLLYTGSGSYSASGTDTLSLTQTLTNNDSFGNVHDFQALQLTGAEGGAGNAVTFGGGAQKAGFQSLWSGNGNDTLTIISTDTLLSYVNAQDGNDYVSVPTLTQFSTLDGGAGIDTLSIDGGVTLNDGQYGGTTVVNFEALQVGCSNDAQSIGSAVTLGGNAASSSLGSLFGSDCNDTITITADDTLPTYVDANQGNDLVTVDFGGGTATNTPFTLTAEDIYSIDYAEFEQRLNSASAYRGFVFGNTAIFQRSASGYAFGNWNPNSAWSLTSGNQSNFTLLGGDFAQGYAGSYYDTLVITGYDSAGTVGSVSLTQSSYYNFQSQLALLGGVNELTFQMYTQVNTIYADSLYLESLSGVPAFNGNTLKGGDGIDTLNIGVAATLQDSDFVNVHNFEAISLSAASSLTLDTLASSEGFSSVYGGTGNDTITITSGNTAVTHLDAGDGNDLVTVASLGQYVSLDGGAGIDTLVLSNTLTNDDSFGNVKRFEALQLSASGSYGNSVTLGASAQTAGFQSILGGGGKDTITVTSGDTLLSYINGGGGNDLVSINSIDQFTTLDGGTGYNTLNLLGGVSLNDGTVLGGTNTTVITNFQALQVGCLNDAQSIGSAVTLGANAAAAGQNSLIGSDCNDTLTILSTDTLPTYLNAQQGNDLVTVDFGGGTASSYVALPQTLGGFELSAGWGIYQNYFPNISGLGANPTFETLSDNGGVFTLVSADWNVATGVRGYLSGSSTASSYYISNSPTLESVNFGSTFAGVDSIVLNPGDPSVIKDFVVKTASGYETLNFPDLLGGPAFNGNTLNGGDGTDTLNVNVPATLGDNDFTNVHSFEALKLNGNNQHTNLVTLGGTAQTTGFSSVFAGTSAAANVDASAYTNNIYITGTGSSYGLTFVGGSGNDTIIGGYGIADSLVGNGGDNLFQFDNAANMGNSTITGAAGIDTLQLTSAGNVNDAFAHDTLLNALVLAGGSNATLAANAQNAGLSSVYLHDSTGSGVYQQAGDTLHSYLSGSSGNDLFQFANDTLLGNDTVAGSGGTDTIAIMSAVTLNDDPFLNVSGVEVLSLTGATTALFAPGGNAQSSGLSSIFGGSGGDSISANFTGANTIYIRGGSGADSISGGGGNDTLQGWTGTSTLNGSSDTMTGGNASDLFILGDATGNAYGQGAKSPIAFITDYNQTVDYLKLNGSAANYSTQTLAGAYNLQVTDTNTGGVVADLYVYNLDQSSFLTGGHVLYA